MTFNCLNIIHMYNFGMRSVDVADQLRMQYRPDRWMRNRKWRWSIFLWGLGGYAKNSNLILYRETIRRYKRNKMYWVPNEIIHFHFIKPLYTHLMIFKKRKFTTVDKYIRILCSIWKENIKCYIIAFIWFHDVSSKEGINFSCLSHYNFNK